MWGRMSDYCSELLTLLCWFKYLGTSANIEDLMEHKLSESLYLSVFPPLFSYARFLASYPARIVALITANVLQLSPE